MSARLEGFDVMDVSTALLHDPKIRRLSREYPEQLTAGFMVYVATMAESWRAGERASIEDAWPSYLPADDATTAALKAVRLVDETGRVLTKAWRGWFTPARKRRESSRRRWSDWKKRQSAKSPDLNGNANGAPTADQPLANGRPTRNRQSVSQSKKKNSSPTAQSQKNGQAKKPDQGQGYDHLLRSDDEIDWLAKPEGGR